jgi:hypothetical protein
VALTFAICGWRYGAGAEFRSADNQAVEQAGGGAGLNRRHAFADQASGPHEPELIVQGGE